MADENTRSHPTNRTGSETSDGDRPAPAKLPIQETQQPDPMLQMSTGRVGAVGLTLTAIVVAAILSVVFYGLNSAGTAEQTAAAPASHSAQPAAAGNSSAATPSAPRANPSGVKS
jgi:hypothetical protein